MRQWMLLRGRMRQKRVVVVWLWVKIGPEFWLVVCQTRIPFKTTIVEIYGA